MKKRILISVLLLALLFGILFGGIFLLRKNANEKEKTKSEEQTVEKKTEEKEEQRKMDFVNVNLLEPYFSAEEIKSMEQQAEKLLKQDELFASITTLTCTDAIYETQNQIRFYFTLDDGSTLFASYKKEDNSFFFWTEKKEDSEQAIAEWLKQKEADTKAVDTSSWEESQELPIKWNEKGQENIPVVLSGKENLQGKISEEDLNCLEIKLQKFLEDNNELRRELSIPADKITQTDQEITFEADFITLSPYMGMDSIEPYLPYMKEGKKGVFVLVRTSNSGAEDFENLDIVGAKKLYNAVGDKLTEMSQSVKGKYGYTQIGGVIGCTHVEEGKEIRERYKNMFFLIPGYGAQGGKAEDVALYLRNGNGGVVNSSRAILLAYKKENKPEEFAACARREAIRMRDEIRKAVNNL